MKQPKYIMFRQILFSFLIMAMIVSCSSLSPYKVPILQGNIFEEKDIEKLSEGLTRDQVQFIFGTALIKDPFHSDRWDYYYSVQVGDKKLNENKLSIFFNTEGLVDSWTIEEIKDSN
mgnify:FL=1|tara:strand:+ start:401 stop:751 length:351 start_codon:yes stop_codon:yes gene_type:complete